MNEGYLQAIENMAYEVNKLTEETFTRLALLGYGPEEALNSLLPGEAAQWDELEKISHAIADTYEMSFEQVTADVWLTMLQNEGMTTQ